MKSEHPTTAWSMYAPPAGGELLELLWELADAGLIETCRSCEKKTAGLVFHSAPGHTAQDIEDTVFAGVEYDAVSEIAQHAARFVVTWGKHRGYRLDEIRQAQGGLDWFRWALRTVETPPELVAALWSYAKVFAADVFDEVSAERESGE